MGLGRSKFPITYEEACSRVGNDVVLRLKDTFEKYASNTGLLPRVTFLKDIFGDGMPPKLAECIYDVFNGGQKGIKFPDLLRGLVVLIHGTKDEKIKFLSQMFGEEGIIRKNDLQTFLAAVDIDPTPDDLDSLFHQENWVGTSEFEEWIKKHPNFSSVTQWLLADMTDVQQQLSFTALPDPPTFYQTLSQKYKVEQQDVMDIEKTYWVLKGNNGKFDETVLLNIMTPTLPQTICKNIFRFLDINHDLFIDLSEMVRGMAMLCRASKHDRIKLCFELLDTDNDGRLNEAEMKEALEMLITIYHDNQPLKMDSRGSSNNEETSVTVDAPADEGTPPDNEGTPPANEGTPPANEGTPPANEGITPSDEGATPNSEPSDNRQPCCDVDLILEQFKENFQDGGVSVDQFLEWSESDSGCGLVLTLLQVILEVCHIKMGLRPSSVEEEMSIVRGYMVRFKRLGRKKGQLVNLISSSWFNRWRQITNFEMKEYPLSSIKDLLPAVELPAKANKPSAISFKDVENVAFGPVGEPADVIEVPGDSTEPDDGFAHIVTDQNSSASSTNQVALSKGGVAGVVVERKGLGPVNNTPLCQPEIFAGSKKLISLTNEGGYLLKNLKEFTDYYVLPYDVWRALILWYGTTGFNTVSTLPRTVIDDEGNLELHPVIFKVYKHTTLPASKQIKTTPWSSFLEIIGYIRGTSETGVTAAPGLAGDSAQPILPRRVLYYTASFDKNTTIQQMCDHMQQTLHIKPEDLRIYDLNNDELPELLDDEEKTIEELDIKDGQSILIETRSKDNTWPEELMAVMKEVAKEELDQEKENEKSMKGQGTRVVCGVTGLSNLGNTCFMNSALQCLSNVQPLKIYFTEKDYYVEINKKNPLGTKGVLAKRYGELVQDLWNGQNKSITPLKFRFTIARHAPQFNNFQQQDAQELLSFVLDGIHEDLNRVQEKPYRELGDSDDRSDHEVADEAWTYHLERNDSIVIDLLQGQLKSVVQCSMCGHKSVKFDPFTFLSLPLPMDEKVQLEVIVVRLDGSQPIRYGLKQELEGKYQVLKEFLKQKMNVAEFMLADIFGGIIRSFPQDKQKMKTGLSGWLYAYETPPPPPVPVEQSESLVMKNSGLEENDGITSEQVLDEKENDESKGSISRVDNIQNEQNTGNECDIQQNTMNEENSTSETNETNIEDVKNDETAPTTSNATCNGKSNETLSVNNITDTKPIIQEEDTDPDVVINQLSAAQKRSSENKELLDSPKKLPTYCSPGIHGFIFAVHRKTLRMENYFISSQKNRPVLFSVPMVVPCLPVTPRCDVYKAIWKQVQRLLIPDPPNTDSTADTGVKLYPFVIKMVGRDGLYCCKCPWYRFCRGCAIPCNTDPIGDDPHYLAVDWDDSFLHLKYQSVLERPKDDESMEALKQQDTKPIDLSDCFKAFSKDEELGEDEYWYCKMCKDHRPAKKTLSIWRLPPILIVHLKRFQFSNGRWAKSQKNVNFPINGLEPKAYDDSVNAGPPQSLDSHLTDRCVSVTPPINEEHDIEPLEVSVEIHNDGSEQCVRQEENAVPTTDCSNDDKEHKEVEPQSKEVEPQSKEEESQSKEEGPQSKEEEEPQSKEEEPQSKEVEPQSKEEEPQSKEVEPQSKEEEPQSKEVEPKSKEEEPQSKEVEPQSKEEEPQSKEEEPQSKEESQSKEEEPQSKEEEPQSKEESQLKEEEPQSKGEEFVIDDTTEPDRFIYDLFAITCHAGILGGGHYTAFAKNPNNKWYYYNDSSCKETTESKVQSESAYMLFYELRGLNNRYNEYRAKSLRQGTRPANLSPPPGNDDEDKDFKDSLRPANTGRGGGRSSGSSGCRTQ